MEGYVNAGSSTLIGYAEKNLGKEYSDKLFQLFSPNMLISFGCMTGAKGTKLSDKDKYLKGVRRQLEDVRRINGIQLMLDSGGFQVITGRVLFSELNKFISYYVEFLNNYDNLFDEAFMLDLPGIMPGGVSTIYEMNKLSLTRLTTEVKSESLDKVMFITQFRDLIYYDAWKKLIYEDDFLLKFKRFSTAGLDSTSKLSKPSVNNYVIGVSMILSKLLKENIKGKYRFHMLGNSTPLYLLLFNLVMTLINEVYGLDFTISYDSSASIRKSNLGKQIDVFDDETKVMYRIDFKYADLKVRNKYRTDKTNEEVILEEVHDMCNQIGYPVSNISSYLYESPTSSFVDPLRAFIALLDGYNTIKVEKYIKEITPKLCKDFLSTNDIVDELTDIIFKFKGKSSIRDSKKLAINYNESLKFITNNPTIEKTDKIIYSYANLLDKEKDDSHYSCWDDL